MKYRCVRRTLGALLAVVAAAAAGESARAPDGRVVVTDRYAYCSAYNYDAKVAVLSNVLPWPRGGSGHREQEAILTRFKTAAHQRDGGVKRGWETCGNAPNRDRAATEAHREALVARLRRDGHRVLLVQI